MFPDPSIASGRPEVPVCQACPPVVWRCDFRHSMAVCPGKVTSEEPASLHTSAAWVAVRPAESHDRDVIERR